MVVRGRVESAREPRAAVVCRMAMLYRKKKIAKKAMPSSATPIQSRPRGQRAWSARASGKISRKPMPKRNAASVTGSEAPMT
jgi:hypothetical protein